MSRNVCWVKAARKEYLAFPQPVIDDIDASLFAAARGEHDLDIRVQEGEVIVLTGGRSGGERTLVAGAQVALQVVGAL
ncbi:MAG TPA: hypothetical protein PLJ34_01450, partial [Hyphomicrobiales bacterium]|nr:hypothetical protein [Hyphomicrobiales bacterium]